MRKQIKLAICLLTLTCGSHAAQSQGWPSWAEDVFGDQRPSFGERYRARTSPLPKPPRSMPQQSATDLRDGGPRPQIAAVAPAVVEFIHDFPANSIVIDTEGRKLYYVLGEHKAYAYPISVGREGFSWTGTELISRKQSWPDWYPPAEMRERDPKLPEKMTGGLRNPPGAMALLPWKYALSNPWH